jgi:hypothetical protein
MNGHTELYDPEGRIDAELPLDHTTHERLARAVLAWSDPDVLRPEDYEQVGLLLAGAARAVADDVRALAGQLPKDDGRRLFAEFVMGQADDCLARPSRNLLRVRNLAAARQFHGREGHLRVPRKHRADVDGELVALGSFLDNTRRHAAKLIP